MFRPVEKDSVAVMSHHGRKRTTTMVINYIPALWDNSFSVFRNIL